MAKRKTRRSPSTGTGSPRPPPQSERRIPVWRVVAPAGLLLALLGVVTALYLRQQPTSIIPLPPPAPEPTSASAAAALELAQMKRATGPWGELVWRVIHLEPPKEDLGVLGCDREAKGCRVESLLAKLRIPPDADIPGITAWWDIGHRRKGVGPLLESVRTWPGGGTIGLVHLLPHRPRRLMFTFPKPGSPPLGAGWTALNFFLDKRDDRFADVAASREELRTRYVEVPRENARFGSVVLYDGGDGAFHACSYLAADLVFVKAGLAPTQPWKIVHLRDIVAEWGLPSEESLRFFVPKPGE